MCPYTKSLEEVHHSIKINPKFSFWRKLLAFIGPGYLISVGYMDPGNWATDLAGGSQFGYILLSVVLLSNLMAMLLQHLSLKLGMVAGKDLAQGTRDRYHGRMRIALWIGAEIAITACDLAEVIGSAIALNLLFHIPILLGVLITTLDVFLLLFLQQKGLRYLEALVISLIAVIMLAFGLEMALAKPDWSSVVANLIPSVEIIKDPKMLYIAVGILGATVMPHNLYLHSALVQSRKLRRGAAHLRQGIRLATIDSTVALGLAFFVNAAILILSAAVFHKNGYTQVAQIEDAYQLLSPLLGTTLASILFAVALLASGHNSTVTGTLAGQVVMEGFVNIKIKPWKRRVITRLMAIVPAIVTILIFGNQGLGSLLVLSQVVLSLQLPFAVIPLVLLTGDKSIMGQFANGRKLKLLAWLVAGLIVGLNGWLLLHLFVL